MGATLTLPAEMLRQRKGLPRAYLRYVVYNADTVLVASGVKCLDKTARDNWQDLFIRANIPVNGFLQVVFINESKHLVRADDFSVRIGEPLTALTDSIPLKAVDAPTNKDVLRNKVYKGAIANRLNLQRSGNCVQVCGHIETHMAFSDDYGEQWETCTSTVDCATNQPIDPPDTECLPAYEIIYPLDCHGEPNGSAYYATCGCIGGNTGIIACDETADCNGEVGGSAYVGPCGCMGGSTGIEECPPIQVDCHGTVNGSAYPDACNTCVGGTTGKTVQTWYQDADNDTWGDSNSSKSCFNAGSGWVLRGSDHNDTCYDTSNDPNQCVCNNPTVSSSIFIGSQHTHVLEPHEWGFTDGEEVTFEISACRDGNQWKAILLAVNGRYSLQARLLPGVAEVTGPSGNTTSANFCAQVHALVDLGYTPGGLQWYMLSAVVAHEKVHETHLQPSLAAITPRIETRVEQYSVPFTNQSQQTAIQQLEAVIFNAGEQTDALDEWKEYYRMEYIDADHVHPGGPTDNAESNVVIPMAKRICQFANSNGRCTDCP